MIQLLQKHSLTVRDKFRPLRMSLKLNEKQSTATITIGPEAPEIIVGDWLRDETDPGAGIVWRVKSVENAYDGKGRTINCEHIINVLSDYLLFGEITPATITGNSKATVCSVNDALRYVLSYQQDWRAESIMNNEEQAYSFNGDDVMSAVEAIANTVGGGWRYDFSSYPFGLGLGTDAISSKDLSRMSMNRNVKTIRMIVDKTRMYTRFYPIGQNDLHLPEQYVSMNEEIYGTICRTETNANITKVDDLRQWAQSRIRDHSFPQVTVSISGLDLSKVTGEYMDTFVLGRECTVPLPEYGTEIVQTITELNYQDKVNDPTNVTVTLANIREDVATIVTKLKKASGSGSRVAARQQSSSKELILNTVKAVQIAGPTNNQYTLQYQLVKDTDWQSAGTFSRAVTSWAVAASAGTIRVTAKPQEQTKNIQVRGAAASWSGYRYTGKIQYSQDGSNWYDTGATYTVDASEIYGQGWAAAYAKVELPKTTQTANSYCYIKTPTQTPGYQRQDTYALVSNTDNSVDLRYYDSTSGWITVARLNHNKYSAGWAAAYGNVELAQTVQTANNYFYIKTPASTEGAQIQSTYGLASNGDNAADVRYWTGSSWVTVARLTHGKYDAGWKAAGSATQIPTESSTSSHSFYIVRPSETNGGATVQESYNMVAASNGSYADLQYWNGSAWVTVARVQNPNAHSNAVTFTKDHMTSETVGSVTIYKFWYTLTNSTGSWPYSGRNTFYY